MKFPIRPAAAIILALALAGCAGGPTARAPEWTLTTPQPDGTNTWFVGYASSPQGDQVAATDAAVSNLVAEIMKYLGVSISSESTATARATLDSYTAEVRTQITATSTGHLAGFAVKDKYIARNSKTGQVFVYVLASYVSADLEKEKRRIAAVFQEKLDAVAKPEAEGRALLQAGRPWEALGRFVDAAVAASGPDVDNGDIKVAADLNSARSALESFHFERDGDSYRGLLGQAFAKPFTARLVVGTGPQGLAAAPLLVSWQRKSGTRLVSRTEAATTDQEGNLSFTPPAPDFVGPAKLVVSLDSASVIAALDKLPARFFAQRDSLEAGLAQKFLEIPYVVESAARQVPTALAIVDLDDSGKPLGQARTQAGLTESLSQAGFALPALSLDGSLVAAGSDAAVLAQAKAALGGRAARLVLGLARITSVRKDGAMFLAQSRVEFKVFDLATGGLILASSGEALGLGQDEAAARDASFGDLGGKALAANLLSSLP